MASQPELSTAESGEHSSGADSRSASFSSSSTLPGEQSGTSDSSMAAIQTSSDGSDAHVATQTQGGTPGLSVWPPQSGTSASSLQACGTTSWLDTGMSIPANADEINFASPSLGGRLTPGALENAAAGPFDPSLLVGASATYLFDAPPQVKDYVETHFRKILPDATRKVMTEMHPRPRTDAMMPQKVDDAVVTWMGGRYGAAKSVDGNLSALQLGLQQAVGPMTCLWSQFEEDPRLASASFGMPTGTGDEHLDIREVVGEVKDVIQRSLVLVGHVHASVSKLRRQLLLEAKDKEIAKIQKDSELPESGQLLFGPSFTGSLVDKVKAGKALSDASRMVSSARKEHAGPMRRPFTSRPPFRRLGSSSFQPRQGAPYSGQAPQRRAPGFRQHQQHQSRFQRRTGASQSQGLPPQGSGRGH